MKKNCGGISAEKPREGRVFFLSEDRIKKTVFDSRQRKYKNPYGAVCSNSSVSFSVTPPRSLGVTGASLCAVFEKTGKTVVIPLLWSGMEYANDIYGGSLETGEYVGLVFYYFRLTAGAGKVLYICKVNDSGAGMICEMAESPWQLSVFRNAPYLTEWFSEGITYQIFPDRFFRSRAPKSEDYPARRIHENWEDMPDPAKPEGEIENSDFFGGDLTGIIQKLPYLHSLHIKTIYLNPIFKAASNHRYDTGDYKSVDPMLGDEGIFSALCSEAAKYGMRIILDGVFNHTGYDSLYFNAKGSYDSIGAYQSQSSPYYSWYTFEQWPEKYSAWWGGLLPAAGQ